MAYVDHVTLTSRSAEETDALARRLAGALRGGETITLIGPIGAGKTTWVQGLAKGLGCSARPNSPTFVLQQWYRGRHSASHPGLVVCHLDLYRLEEPAEIARLGLLEPLDSQQVTVIEWADRAGSLLPPDRLSLTFGLPVMPHVQILGTTSSAPKGRNSHRSRTADGEETERVIVAQLHGRGHEHLMAAFEQAS
jgi:tRNA threonylcarbamoyladenosine biosynthesis protein TsaE